MQTRVRAGSNGEGYTVAIRAETGPRRSGQSDMGILHMLHHCFENSPSFLRYRIADMRCFISISIVVPPPPK
jgi:hypothetical protein